jgi:hypothetical protein
MKALRLGIATAIAVGALGIAAPAAHADNPPCRMTPREFRNVRVDSFPKRGMTRKFVQQMVGCGGRTEYYVEYPGGYSYRVVSYKRTTPVGAIAYLTYAQDRVESKAWSVNGSGAGFPFGIPF